MLQRTLRVARLLEDEVELCDPFSNMVHDGLLFTHCLESLLHVIQQTHDGVGLRLNLIDELAPCVELGDLLVGFRKPRKKPVDVCSERRDLVEVR